MPIHTEVLTSLTKYDGVKSRRLRSREFHQIAGRAGRAGFDSEGLVIAEAPEHDIENAKLVQKAGGDPKKLRKIKRKKPPEGFVNWNEQTFERLVASSPEVLRPHMRVSHSMVLSLVERGGDALENISDLIDLSMQTPDEKVQLKARAEEILDTLVATGVVEKELVGAGSAGAAESVEGDEGADGVGGADDEGCAKGVEDADGDKDTEGAEGASWNYSLTMEMPASFSLDQPLSPFLLAVLDMLSMEDPNYALDLISLVEATLENPFSVLRAQQRRARDEAAAEMKAAGIGFEERLERLANVSYPRPLEDELNAAFEHYCEAVPWARDYELAPKSVLRDMIETASDFKTYVARYKIARSEGTLLRYLSDVFRVLARTIPEARRDERLNEVIDWLRFMVQSIDSSLMDEWAQTGDSADDIALAPPPSANAVVADRRGLVILVRNALFLRVRLASLGRCDELGSLDCEAGYGAAHWERVLEGFYEVHEEIRIDADARSHAYLLIDEADEVGEHLWHVRQIFLDEDADCDFAIAADVDLDATQEEGEAVFVNYRVGFVEDIA